MKCWPDDFVAVCCCAIMLHNIGTHGKGACLTSLLSRHRSQTSSSSAKLATSWEKRSSSGREPQISIIALMLLMVAICDVDLSYFAIKRSLAFSTVLAS